MDVTIVVDVMLLLPICGLEDNIFSEEMRPRPLRDDATYGSAVLCLSLVVRNRMYAFAASWTTSKLLVSLTTLVVV